MGRRSKGRRDHGTGVVSKWSRNGVHIGWKGYVELSRGADGKRKHSPPIYRRGTSMDVRKALEKEVEALAEQHRGGTDIEISVRNTLQEYLEDWLQTVAPLTAKSPLTIEDYETKLRCHVYEELGKIRLGELRPRQIQLLYAKLRREKELGDNTVHHVHRVLRKALNDAVRGNILQSNPANAVKLATPRPEEAEFIPPQDIPAVCDALVGLTAMATGFRRGEMCALRWNDLDWGRGKIRVDEACKELHKDDGGLIYGPPKSKKSRRSVMVPPEIMQVLREHRRKQTEERLRLGADWRGEDFVFTSPNGAPLRPSTVSQHWKLVRERTGIESVRDVKLHGLRHTHATLLLLAGVQPKVVMDRLGQASVALGQDIYSHVIRSMEEEVADKISAIMPQRRAAK